MFFLVGRSLLIMELLGELFLIGINEERYTLTTRTQKSLCGEIVFYQNL